MVFVCVCVWIRFLKQSWTRDSVCLFVCLVSWKLHNNNNNNNFYKPKEKNLEQSDTRDFTNSITHKISKRQQQNYYSHSKLVEDTRNIIED